MRNAGLRNAGVDLGACLCAIADRAGLPGVELWIASLDSAWISVDSDPVFGPVAEGPLRIDTLTVLGDGTIAAIGAVPVLFEGHEPSTTT